jgi:hypothetical protein
MILNLFTYNDHLFAVTSKSAILSWNLEELATKDSIPKISSPLGISFNLYQEYQSRRVKHQLNYRSVPLKESSFFPKMTEFY